jgi:hypothetical protein
MYSRVPQEIHIEFWVGHGNFREINNWPKSVLFPPSRGSNCNLLPTTRVYKSIRTLQSHFTEEIMGFLLKGGGIYTVYSNHGALTTSYVAGTDRGTAGLCCHKPLPQTAFDWTSLPWDLDVVTFLYIIPSAWVADITNRQHLLSSSKN